MALCPRCSQGIDWTDAAVLDEFNQLLDQLPSEPDGTIRCPSCHTEIGWGRTPEQTADAERYLVALGVSLTFVALPVFVASMVLADPSAAGLPGHVARLARDRDIAGAFLPTLVVMVGLLPVSVGFFSADWIGKRLTRGRHDLALQVLGVGGAVAATVAWVGLVLVADESWGTVIVLTGLLFVLLYLVYSVWNRVKSRSRRERPTWSR